MTRRILIIEDTPTIARVQKHIAQKVGYEADIAGSLAEAKELISKHSFFCAVVDFILPDAPNGEAVPCTIEADIPTIVMTGNLDETTRNIVEKHPIIDYITKENKQAYQYLEKQILLHCMKYLLYQMQLIMKNLELDNKNTSVYCKQNNVDKQML